VFDTCHDYGFGLRVNNNNNKTISIAPDLLKGALGAGKPLPQPLFNPKNIKIIKHVNLCKT
jgi:hypothetical protein